jgi:multisubunit Na+/H+ antiporter MnhE subunit
MVQSKALRPEWLPAVALSAVLAALMLVWDPRVGDLAAQVFHTELFQHAGLAIWNGSWYGGHYTLNYSLLFPPAAALLGPQVVGMLSVVASSYLFDRLVRDHWGAEARWATLWFAAGVVTLLADGQLTFALGVALGLASLRSLQMGRGTLAILAAAACPLASPVAGAFLAGIVAAGAWERGKRLNRTAVAAAAIAFVLTVVPNLAFPEPGRFPFATSSFISIPLWCGAVLFLTWKLDGEARLRRVVLGYLVAAIAVFLLPNALGGNAVRLGALFGGPLLAAVLLSHRPLPVGGGAAASGPGLAPPARWVPRWFYTLVLVITLAASLYWQFTASVTQVARAVGDPSTSASYFQPAARWLVDHGARGTRIEVPPTANHWESAYLAPKFELARGWLRQLDTARDDIFYEEGALDERSYGRWLRGNAISYVALPDAPLDYSSTEEASLILAAPPYLRERFHGEHWRIYEVRHPKPMIEPLGNGRASTVSVGRQGFSLDVTSPGEFLVRVSFTPYWSIGRGAGCLLRRGNWTVARTAHPGIFSVDADFSIDGAWNAMTGAKKTC